MTHSVVYSFFSYYFEYTPKSCTHTYIHVIQFCNSYDCFNNSYMYVCMYTYVCICTYKYISDRQTRV